MLLLPLLHLLASVPALAGVYCVGGHVVAFIHAAVVGGHAIAVILAIASC